VNAPKASTPWPWIFGGVLFLLLLGLPVAVLRRPRGYRNNNPGNLRPMPKGKWAGEVAPDNGLNGPYSRFESPYHGFRAMTIDVYGDIVNGGQNTIKRLVSGTPEAGFRDAYAPGSDKNNEAAYINYLVKATGLAADFPLSIYLHGPALLHAITMYENSKLDPDSIWTAEPRLNGMADGQQYLKTTGRLA